MKGFTFQTTRQIVSEPGASAQLGVLPDLHRRLKPYRSHATVDTLAQRLDTNEKDFRDALKAVDVADAKVEAQFAEENDTRRAIREQMEVAYGKLRGFYKARPAQADSP